MVTRAVTASAGVKVDTLIQRGLTRESLDDSRYLEF